MCHSTENNDLFAYEAMSMITGKLLGDGNLIQEHGRQARFRFSHCIKDKEWTYFCFEQLNKYIPLSAPKHRKIVDPRIKKGYTENYYVQSKNHKKFSILKDIWYPSNKKIIPFDFIENYLNPLSLAWWYQDDGSLKKKSSKIEKIILSTESFTYRENSALAQLLYKKFYLTFSQDKQNRLLLYDQKQILYFLHLVKPYVHPCMSRKLIAQNLNKTVIKDKKRTTITLPDYIKVNAPTKEIHQILNYLPRLIKILKSKHQYEYLFKNNFYLDKAISRKSYQLTLYKEQLIYLEKCKNLCGLNVNQLTELCYVLSNEEAKIPK